MDELLSASYADERRRLVGAEASDELRPGRPGGRVPRLPGWASDPRGSRASRPAHGESAFPAPSEPGRRDTSHVDVADRFGNLVSATPSGGWLQSSPAIEELGFCLGTRAQMFWLEQGLASSLSPGRRPRTTLSPSLALRDGEPYLAFGTPGGDQQDQWPLLFLLYHVDFGLDLQAAVDAANWHTTHPPSSFYPRGSELAGLHAEASLGEDVLDELRRRGHVVTREPAFSQGRVTAVGRGTGGLLRAAADARGAQAYAVGR